MRSAECEVRSENPIVSFVGEGLDMEFDTVLDGGQDVVIACVNDEVLSLSQLVRQMGVADDLKFFDGYARGILIRQLAQREGVMATQEDLQRKVDEWRYQHRLERVEDTEDWLTQRGVTLQDVADDAETRRLEYLLSVQVTEGEIEPYFANHRLDFDAADVCWIFVRDEGAVEEIGLQICEEEADFYAMARQYSEDETTRPAGGYLGRLRRKQLPKGIAARVFAAEVGDVVGPEKVSGGYALYVLQQFYPAELNDVIRKEIRKRLFGQWLQRETHQANIHHPIWEDQKQE